MTNKLRAALRELMDQRGLRPKPLSLAAGLHETAVRDILDRSADPRIETVSKLARALGVSIDELYFGRRVLAQTVPVIGAVSAGEGWVPIDDGGNDAIEMSVEGEAVALAVRGDSMEPVFRAGDLIIGVKLTANRTLEAIGEDCIVLTDSGERYLKIVQKSPARGCITLKSYNPRHDDIETVRPEWVAPIRWVRRAGRGR